MEIKKEIIEKTYREQTILVETTMEVHYDTIEERQKFEKFLDTKGYVSSWEEKRNIGTEDNPKYVFVSRYYNYKIEKV